MVLALCCWLVVITSAAMGEELAGTVRSVDVQSRQLVLAQKSEGDQVRSEHLVTVKLPERIIFKRPNGRLLPGWARVGNTIAVRGNFSQGNELLFIMRTVNHRFMNHRHDPTGVRLRIGRGCGRMMPEADDAGPGKAAMGDKESTGTPGENVVESTTGEVEDEAEVINGFGIGQGGGGDGGGNGNGGDGGGNGNGGNGGGK